MATAGATRPEPGVAEKVAEAPLGPQARVMLAPGQTAAGYVSALTEAGLLEDAVRATAFLLPRREAVWWAMRCARSVPAAVADPKAVAALDAAAKWAAAPSDDARRAAFAAAEAAGIDNPAGAIGAAVYFAEGSLAPPKQPVVPPAPVLTPMTLANAVLLAAVIAEPERAPERLKAFVELGGEVAAGKDRWAESRPATPPGRPPYPPYTPPPTRPR